MEEKDDPVTKSASGRNRPALADVRRKDLGPELRKMDLSVVSGLNGLHYRKESYFDFVVSDRPKYTPGSGPPLAPVSALLPDDQDGFIIGKGFVQKDLVYVVGYKDKKNLRVSVKAQNIMDWVSPRAYEQWESDEYDRKVREEEEAKLPAILAKEERKQKRLEKLSREGGPKIDGRKRKAGDMTAADSYGPRKKGKPGRPPKKDRGFPNTTPGSVRKSQPEMFTSPRRLSQHSNQPSLSTPTRGVADIVNLESETEEDGDDDEDKDEDEDIEQALANQLNGARDPSLSKSSRSSSHSRSHPGRNEAIPGGDKRRRSLIGGGRENATAATSSLDAFKVFESIEKSHKNEDNPIYLDRSPFKRESYTTSNQSNTALGRTLRETRSSSRQKSATPLSAKELLWRSNRKKSTATPPPPPSSDEGEAEYEVDSIAAHEIRVVNGKNSYYYLVRWVGYPEDENTWEPAENVGNGAIEEYKKLLRGKEKSAALNKTPQGFRAPLAPMG